MINRKIVTAEKNTHKQVAEYLRAQWPKILFRTDMSGIMLTVGQRVNAERLQNGDKWPDLFIAEFRWNLDEMVDTEDWYGKPTKAVKGRGFYAGLFLEIKKDGTKLKKRNGEWASDHIREQAECMARLEAKGYKCSFAVGFHEAKSIIDNYLK